MNRRKEIIAILILFLVVCLRFSPFIFQGKPIDSDAWKCIYPWKSEFRNLDIKSTLKDMNVEYGIWYPIVKEEIDKGKFPHWNMYSFCGTPLYANHLTPVFHVPFAISLLWPSNLVATAYIFLMALLGATFFYWFLRNSNFGIFSSLAGGVIYVLSGWLCNLAPPEIVVMVWVPAILLFFDRFMRSKHPADICLCAFCSGQLLIAGYPILIAHFVYVLIAYSIWRFFQEKKKQGFSFKTWIFAVVTICVLGLMFSAVQNYPTFKLMKLSTRDVCHHIPEIDTNTPACNVESDIEMRPYPPGKPDRITPKYFQILKILIPNFDGGPYTNRMTIGPFMFFLFLYGLLFTDRKFIFFKVCLVVFGILGFFAPLYGIASNFVPGWLITPFLPVEVFFFSLFFLSALGMEGLLKSERRSTATLTLLILTVALLIFCITVSIHNNELMQFKRYRWNPEIDNAVKWSFILLSTFLVIFTYNYSKIGNLRRYFRVILFSVLIASGMLAQFYIYPYFLNNDLMPLNPEMESIIATCDNGRIIRFDTKTQILGSYIFDDYLLPPNVPARFHIMDSFGYDSLMLNDYFRFYERYAPGSVICGRGMLNISKLDYLIQNDFFFQSAGIRYCISKDHNQLDTVFGSPVYDGSIQIYEVKSVEYPYARFYSSFEYHTETPDRNEKSGSNAVVYLESKPALPNGRPLLSADEDIDSDSIQISRTHTSMEISYNAPKDCILYISDSYHPNWRAKLDNEPVEIIKANIAFRAIAVPKGVHTVTMWYDGSDVVKGGLVSILALFLCIVIILVDKGRHRQARNKD